MGKVSLRRNGRVAALDGVGAQRLGPAAVELVGGGGADLAPHGYAFGAAQPVARTGQFGMGGVTGTGQVLHER